MSNINNIVFEAMSNAAKNALTGGLVSSIGSMGLTAAANANNLRDDRVHSAIGAVGATAGLLGAGINYLNTKMHERQVNQMKQAQLQRVHGSQHLTSQKMRQKSDAQ